MDPEELMESLDANPASDRVLLVEGRKFHVNSARLSESSEFFNGLFNFNFMEKEQKEIELKDISAADFESFLLTVNSEAAEITENTFAGSFRLAGRFLCYSVMIKCINFIKTGQNFAKFPVKNLLEWSQGEGYAEMKDLIKERLITNINRFSGITLDSFNQLLYFMEPGTEQLQNAEKMTMEFFYSEKKQNELFHIYYELSKQYNFYFLEAVLYNFLEKKILSPDQLKDMFTILKPEKKVVPVEDDDEDIQVIWPPFMADPPLDRAVVVPNSDAGQINEKESVKVLVTIILHKCFNHMDHSEHNLNILLELAEKFNFVSLKNEICTLLENDFMANQNFKYCKLALQYNLVELLTLMRYRLRTSNPATFSDEDKNAFFISPEVKDFVLQNILNM